MASFLQSSPLFPNIIISGQNGSSMHHTDTVQMHTDTHSSLYCSSNTFHWRLKHKFKYQCKYSRCIKMFGYFHWLTVYDLPKIKKKNKAKKPKLKIKQQIYKSKNKPNKQIRCIFYSFVSCLEHNICYFIALYINVCKFNSTTFACKTDIWITDYDQKFAFTLCDSNLHEIQYDVWHYFFCIKTIKYVWNVINCW